MCKELKEGEHKLESVKRSMFKGSQLHQFSDILLEKSVLVIKDSNVYPKYKTYFTTDLKMEVLELFETYFNGKEWSKVKFHFHSQINVKKRKRWVKKALKDLSEKTDKKPKELYAYYLTIINDVKLELNSVEHFEQNNVNPREKLQLKINEIKSWESDFSQPISSYPFLKDKSKVTIKRAILDDIALILVYFLEEEWTKPTPVQIRNQSIKEFPFEKQVIFDNKVPRKPIKFDGELELEGEIAKFKTLGTKEEPVNLMIQEDESIKKITEKFGVSDSIKDLDYYDRELFAAVLDNRDERFAIDSTITTTLGQLVKDVFQSDGKKNYNNVIERLIKLRKVTFAEVMDNGKARVFGFFDYIELSNDKYDSMKVDIVINKAIHDTYINKQTLRIYKDQLNLLEKPLHSFLLYIQKERILAYRAGIDYSDITISKFSSNVRFSAKRKADVRKEISKSLDRLIETKVLINNYVHGNELFRVQFIPMDENEVRDIVNYNKDETPTLDNLLSLDTDTLS